MMRLPELPLSWRNLLHEKARAAAAVAGVCFAIVMVFLQLGFFDSAVRSATAVYGRLDFDLLLTSPEYLHLTSAGTFPRIRLDQARSVPGVASVSPLYVGYGLWRNAANGNRRAILVMGIDLAARTFDPQAVPTLADLPPALRLPDTVLFDDRSRAEFGPRAPGLVTEIGSRNVEIVGLFHLGTGFAADGAVLTSDQNFSRFFGGAPLERVSLGLVRLEPAADPKSVAEQLGRLLGPQDVTIFPRAVIEAKEAQHWKRNTSVGVIFFLGAFIALAVGTVVVYQVLCSHITAHYPEYATLKAMGYSDRSLFSTVLEQAVLLGVLAFVPAYLVSLLLYGITRAATDLPIVMTAGRAGAVFVVALGMSVVSGLISLRKVQSADPAELF